MDEIEKTSIYEELATKLNKLNRGWVVEQVAETVQAGKTVEERFSNRKTPLLKLEDYTEHEQLLLILDAIERATVHSLAMEIQLADFVHRDAETTDGLPTLTWAAAGKGGKKILEFSNETLVVRQQQSITLQKTLDRFRLAINDSTQTASWNFSDIQRNLESVFHPIFITAADQSNLFACYIFSLLLKAISNEEGKIEYQDISENSPSSLIFRKNPGKIHGTAHPYTYAVVEFPNKPPLEVHIGVKVQGRTGSLHDCDILVLYRREATICRLLKQEPRHSQTLLAIKCQHSVSPLKIDVVGSFMGLASDIRNEGGCYFVSNHSSPEVAKSLALYRRKWEHNIFPESRNDVNRLLYSLQTILKDFKARR